MATLIKLSLRVSSRISPILTSNRYSTASPVSNQARQLTEVIYHQAPETKGIVELCLNRPEAKNALNKVLVDEIFTGVESISTNREVRCVLLRSLVKGVFCAGADLKERLTLSEDQVTSFVSRLRAMTSALEAIPAPVIAVLEGSAYGGGLEMALACDLRVAASGVEMGLVETKLAIIPGAGGTQRLSRIIGIPRAKELIYTGRVLDAAEAKEYHLISQLVPQSPQHNAAYTAALQLARQIAANGPVAVRAAKVAIDRGARMSQEDGMMLESLCYGQVVRTQDRVEGLKAFAGKYKPIYKGS